MSSRPFTGRHMTAILVAFFGVVIGVNVTMATLAARTFGGTVVDNSYVASQEFNRWLREARAEGQLGWTTHVALDGSRRLVVEASEANLALAGATVKAVARHPLGRMADVPLALRQASPGRFVSRTAIPAGRWLVHIEIVRGNDRKRLIEQLS